MKVGDYTDGGKKQRQQHTEQAEEGQEERSDGDIETLPGGGARQWPAAVHPHTPAVACGCVTLHRVVKAVCSAFWDETLVLPD